MGKLGRNPNVESTSQPLSSFMCTFDLMMSMAIRFSPSKSMAPLIITLVPQLIHIITIISQAEKIDDDAFPMHPK